MKKITTLLLLILLSSTTKAQIPSWAVKDSLGYNLIARNDAGMISFNNKLYILGFYDFKEYDPITGIIRKLNNPAYVGSTMEQCFYEVLGKMYYFRSSFINVYDPSVNSWSIIDYPTGFNSQPDAGFVINNIIYIASRNSTDFYAFNPTSNTFTPKAARPGGSTGRYAFSFDLAGKGYWGGFRTYMTDGCNGGPGCFDNSFYEYDPNSNAWTAKASLPTSITTASAIGYNGKGYVGLGSTVGGLNGIGSAYWYEYNPSSNSWLTLQNFPGTPSNSSISKIGNEIYVFGGKIREQGQPQDFVSDNLYKYTPANNQWQNVNLEMGQNRTEAAGFYSNGKIYTGGGHDSESLTDFWEYSIASNQWTPKASFKSSFELRAAAEVNGKGYFVGGYNHNLTSNHYIDSLVEYNPLTNLWTQKASFPGGVRRQMIALQHNGKLYAGMGNNENGYQYDFYSYNPSSNSWTTLPSLPYSALENPLYSFVIGDTAYIVTSYTSMKLHKFAFQSNTWDGGTNIPLSIVPSSDNTTNSCFSFNGKGYLSTDVITEYNPQTGLWKVISTKPFKNKGHLVVSTPNEVYFGFGSGDVNSMNGSYTNRNTWNALRFNANISNNIGVFAPVNYLEQCGTGTINTNMVNTVHDTLGNLFTSIQVQSGSMSSICYSVNSRDTLLPYYQGCGNLGNGIVNAMFMKKSVLIPNTSYLSVGSALTFYYTTSELNQFVQAFNLQNGTNKTIILPKTWTTFHQI